MHYTSLVRKLERKRSLQRMILKWLLKCVVCGRGLDSPENRIATGGGLL
jgi:hypothetical protein